MVLAEGQLAAVGVGYCLNRSQPAAGAGAGGWAAHALFCNCVVLSGQSLMCIL